MDLNEGQSRTIQALRAEIARLSEWRALPVAPHYAQLYDFNLRLQKALIAASEDPCAWWNGNHPQQEMIDAILKEARGE